MPGNVGGGGGVSGIFRRLFTILKPKIIRAGAEVEAASLINCSYIGIERVISLGDTVAR